MRDPSETTDAPGAAGEEGGADAAAPETRTPAACCKRVDPTCLMAGLDRLLQWCRATFPAALFDRLSEQLLVFGHYALLCAQGLAVVFGMLAAVKLSRGAFILYGFGFALLLVILQYTATRFLSAGRQLVQTSPSRLATPAFLDCFALLAEVTGILLFVIFLARARVGLFWVGLGLWALCDALAFVAIHPALVNVTVDERGSAGEEAVGILSFFAKAVVRIVPLAFSVGAITGSLGLLFAVFPLARSGELTTALAALRLIVLCTCLPFLTYIAFALYHLAIDLLDAILSLSRR